MSKKKKKPVYYNFSDRKKHRENIFLWLINVKEECSAVLQRREIISVEITGIYFNCILALSAHCLEL